MVRERPTLGVPFGADGPWLSAILDVLGDLHDMLDARLPPRPESGGPVRVSEPERPTPPAEAVPVSEPAPDIPPAREDDDAEQVGDTSDAVPVREPAPDSPTAEPAPELPEPPPRAGRGSSLKAWQQFAAATGVEHEENATRDDIVAACVKAGVLSET